MNFKSLAVATFVWCSISLPATAQFVELNQQGQKFEKNYELSGDGQLFYSIPLPAGTWTFVRGNEITTNVTNSKMREQVLSNIDNGTLNMSAFIRAKVDSNPVKWNDEPCKGNDFIYKNDYGLTLWDQRCLTIRTGTYLQQSDNKVQQISRDFYTNNNIKYPQNCLQVTYTQYARNGRFLNVQFYVLPENYGLENPITAVLTSSPWHLSNYKNDPKKVKFIEAIRTWAESYAEALNQTFVDGKATKMFGPSINFVD